MIINKIILKIRKKKLLTYINNDDTYYNYDEYKDRLSYRGLLINLIKHAESMEFVDKVLCKHNYLNSTNVSYRDRIIEMSHLHDTFNEMVTLVTVLQYK